MIRDFVSLHLAHLALCLATPRTRARIRVCLIRAQGLEPSESLIAQAELARTGGA